MSSTFLNLTNMLLRRLNEVEIAESDFRNTRGVQSLAKDAIKASISKINQMEFQWPFNAVEHTQTLTKGISEYEWPIEQKTTIWDSFQIQKDSSLGVGYRKLDYISRNDWFRLYRDLDNSTGSKGRGVPSLVFPSHGTGFGVSPSPDAGYTVKFRYYDNYTVLDRATDTASIPSTFDTTIVDGAVYYMYLFRDNVENAGLSLQTFMNGVKSLRTLYINHYDHVVDRRTNYGGRL